MKFNRTLRNTMAAGVSLAVVLGSMACSRDYTAAYVYAISSANGNIAAFGVDYQSGVLTQLNGSPFSSQLTNPVTVLPSPNNLNLYLIGGTQQSEVEAFNIGTDGKLYGINTYNFANGGTYGTAAAFDSTGKFLYVTYQYQVPYGPLSQGPGGITIYPVNSDGSLGTPTNVNVGNHPVGIAVTVPTCSSTPVLPGTVSGTVACTTSQNQPGYENVFVYVVDQENYTNAPAAQPTIVSFVQNPTTGALTLLSGTALKTGTGYGPAGTYQSTLGINAGVQPSAIAVDPTGRWLYVTDEASNKIYGYATNSNATAAASGNVTPLQTSPYTTGLYPVSITIDPRGKYVYATNYNSSTVSSFSLTSATGALGGSAAVGNFAVSTGPSCITIEPSLGIYLYTSNRLDNSISGGQLSPDTGQITAVPDTPFPTISQPTCITSVANGSHAAQYVTQ
jgi:6-phosphogluconolactonase (cycloisomerase 2 family)